MQVRKYYGSWDCLKKTVRTGGLIGLYRGSAMPWISHLIKRPIQFPIAEYMKKVAKEKNMNGYYHNYLIGGSTALIGPIFGTPLQVVKVATQTSNGKDHKNSFEYIKHNYTQNGIRGFYRGFIPTIFKDCIFGMSFIGHYYTLRDILGTDRWYKNFISGATAHCLTWFAFIPIDYVKTNIQRSEKKLTISQAIKNGYRSGGIRVFWKGVIPACLRTIPVSGIAMTGYEFVRSRLTKDMY